MIKKIVSVLLFLSCCLSLAAQQTDYSRYILTPKAPAAPRINGPKVYGNYPGTPFLYKIPATGQRPMTFSAKGLPKGLKRDRNTGIISGKVRKQGTWKVTFTASNARGSDSREFKIVIGGKLCLTPPMGWNSWNTFAKMQKNATNLGRKPLKTPPSGWSGKNMALTVTFLSTTPMPKFQYLN